MGSLDRDAEQVHQASDVAAGGVGLVKDAVKPDGLGWQAELVTDPLRTDGLDAEFASECDKFDAEIAKVLRINKLNVAELDEEEQNLDRLRRWWRELRARDIFGVREGVDAEVFGASQPRND